jgi:peroxiredoxin
MYKYRPQRGSPAPNDSPKVLVRYDVELSKFGMSRSPAAFVPAFKGVTLITDYRKRPLWEEYLADHWLDVGDRERHSPLPADLNEPPEPGEGPRVSSSDALAGQEAPAFRATTTDENVVEFPGGYKGKVVMLDFWATWCRPCVAELPSVAAAYEKFHPLGFDILGVSLDDAGATRQLQKFRQDHHMPWPQIYDGKSWESEIAKRYSIDSIPCAFLVDGDTGSILSTGDAIRGERLVPALEKAMTGRKNK